MEDADGGCRWKNADSADSKRRMEKMLINQKSKNKKINADNKREKKKTGKEIQKEKKYFFQVDVI